MKILGRTLIILVAALVVVGATVAFAGGGAFEAEEGRDTVAQEQVAGSSSTVDSAASSVGVSAEETSPASQVSGRPPGEDRGGSSLFGVIGVVQNFVIISVIVTLVTLAPRVKGVLARFAASFHN